MNLFQASDRITLQSDLPQTEIIKRIKANVHLSYEDYTSLKLPSTDKAYFGIFKEPNEFTVKRTLNLMTWSMNLGIKVDLLVSNDSPTELAIKIKNISIKLVVICVTLLFTGVITGLTYQQPETEFLDTLPFYLLPTIFLTIGIIYIKLDNYFRKRFFEGIIS